MRLQPVFRDLTSGSRLLTLVLVILLCGILSLSFSYLLSVLIWGKSVLEGSGDPDMMNLGFMRLTQMLNQVGFFLLPPFVFALLSERYPLLFLGFYKPGFTHIIAALLLLLAAGPLTGYLTEWNERLILPPQLSGLEEWMRTSEDTASKLTNRLLNDTGTSALIVNILMIGVLPSLGEELLFRSALIGLFRKVFHGVHLPVIISAFLFSALHLQFFGFLPRFMLGLLFGYLYVWSGSIWVPIVAHFLNNTIVVVASFLFNQGISSIPAEEMGSASSGTGVVFSAIALLFLMFWVYYTRKNATISGGIQDDL
ncbi:MAG: CPBP family intramembrane metalloprotease [Bacteroidales bacterium]|nr:CPBP family intramembrane metalloprotease [Bacteroidales bacterium]